MLVKPLAILDLSEFYGPDCKLGATNEKLTREFNLFKAASRWGRDGCQPCMLSIASPSDAYDYNYMKLS